MITDTLLNAKSYYKLNASFEQSFEFLKTLKADTPVGSYEIAPGLMAHVSEYETSQTFKHGWETHKKYIDIQFCLTGKEYIKWRPLSDSLVPTTNYNESKDCTFYKDSAEQGITELSKTVFALFFPRDAHAPQIMIEKPEKVKKVVIKVPVE